MPNQEERIKELTAYIDRLHKASLKLVNHVSEQYNIESYDDFTCPLMRDLAMAVKETPKQLLKKH